jgi:ATP-dependent protease ClpP protease subunit
VYTTETKKSILILTKNVHVFRYSGRIDEKLYNKFIHFCMNIPTTIPGQKLYLHICSSGGDLGWSSKIVGLMNSLCNVQKITIGYNKVHSSAIPIFATGDIRKVKDRNVRFLFHLPAATNNVSEEDRKRSEDSSFEYIAERMNQPTSIVHDLAIKTTYLEATEAMQLGLVHEILK